MQVDCCYRLIPNGEVIHGKYDTIEQTIAGMPSEWFTPYLLELPEYSLRNYDNCKSEFDKMCETVLLSNDAFALVVEDNNIGYYILQFDGTKRFVSSSIDKRESTSDCYIPGHELYKSVGFRRTRPIQLRSLSGIYRLVMNKRTGLFYTDDGVLEPNFDVSKLCQVDYHYAGYKDMIANNHYAVVYIDNAPVFLDMVDKHTLSIAY